MVFERSRLAFAARSLFGAPILVFIGFGVGIGFGLWLSDSRATGIDAQAMDEAPRQEIVGAGGEGVRIAHEGMDAVVSTRLELRDARGKVVAIEHVSGNGQIVLQSPEPELFPFTFSRYADGSLVFGGRGGYVHATREGLGEGWVSYMFKFHTERGEREFRVLVNPKGEAVFTNPDDPPK